MTVDHVYVFTIDSLSRRHRVTNIGAIILSKISSEVVLHYPEKKDLHIRELSKPLQQELISVLQLRYANLKPDKTLELYGVDMKSLSDFARNNAKSGFANLPPIKYRLRDKEIKGTEDDFEK